MRSAAVLLATALLLVLGAGTALCIDDGSGNCTGRVLHGAFITPPDATHAVVLATAPGAADPVAAYHSVVLDPVAPPPRG